MSAWDHSPQMVGPQLRRMGCQLVVLVEEVFVKKRRRNEKDNDLPLARAVNLPNHTDPVRTD